MSDRHPLRILLALLAVVAVVAAACDSDSSTSDTSTTSEEGGGEPALPMVELVFNGEGNNLNAYDPATGESQRIITNADEDPDGLDINAQICFDPGAPGKFIAGEDTDQPESPAGWGYFQLEGAELGDLTATQEGKLAPTYQDSSDNPEMYGCGFLSDGRLVTTDVGNQAEGDGDGQLIIWFPPFDSDDVAYCKLDVAIPTAQQVLVDDGDRVLVASARGPAPHGILAYTGPFPTSDDAEGGCGATDATGAPVADSVNKEVFIPADDLIPTTTGIAAAPDGGYYVSSVFNGVIAEFDEAGSFVRTILEPPEGEVLSDQTFSTGTPLGLGVDSTGNIYFADIGVVIMEDSIGPGDVGSLQMISFVDGEPQSPEVVAFDLAFPDGIGIWTPSG
ncbi:MAG: hypothetical protein M5U31_10825 [Acidimicrobiia bacterium]|nr:hypothetical protein [Acidimicrobiia bacterium]